MKLRIDFYDEDRPDGDQLLFFVEESKFDDLSTLRAEVVGALEDAWKMSTKKGRKP
jgi:hypothetical protein